ncbi:MAG TPA: FAD:protein FMN transferase [Candidatus Fimivivens sp.]|nr:FAD:protein FMN transferase [Candidatus Fimivivens sp.]
MSIPRTVEREVKGEIMRTDIFVMLAIHPGSSPERDLDDAFSMFRDVASRFSRFSGDSELSLINASGEMRVSSSMSELLSFALDLHRETAGLFDPSILTDLEALGYAGSFGGESFGTPLLRSEGARYPFTSLSVDMDSGIVRKPEGLRIDLGGIAKGFAVDRVARMLRERGYPDFLVDAGGDIFVSGRDVDHGYGYWAIDIAVPASVTAPILMLSDMAVATSGIDRRKWFAEGEERHHLVDPRTGNSAATDIVSATVVMPSVVRAEVFAKTLCILGSVKALAFAEERHIPVFLVTVNGETMYNQSMKPYVYEHEK